MRVEVVEEAITALAEYARIPTAFEVKLVWQKELCDGPTSGKLEL